MRSTSFPALIILLLTLLLHSCTKNGGTNNHNNNGNKAPTAVSTYLLKQATTVIYDPADGTTLDSSVSNYTYDSTKRLTTLSGFIFAGQGSSLDTDTYIYNTGTITVTADLVTLSQPSTWQAQTFTYYLDPISGYADSAKESVSLFGGPGTPVALFQYTYSNGYLTQLKSYTEFGGAPTLESTSTYIISGGNTVSISATSTAGNSSETFTFGSSTNTAAYFSNNLAVTGKPNSSLVTSSTATGPGGSTTLNYTYTFDSQNRVTAMTAKSPDGQVEQRASFVYY